MLEFQRQVNNPKLFHVVCLCAGRHRAFSFLQEMRKRLTDHQYSEIQISWEGLEFAVISIPLILRERAEHVADKHGLRIQDGIPNVIDDKGQERWFPISGRQVFTIVGNT